MSHFEKLIDGAMGTCLRQFGDQVIYIPEDSAIQYQVSGIFDEAVTLIDTSGEVPVESRAPVLSIRLKDFDRRGIRRPQEEDHFIIKGRRYRVIQNPEDGWAESRLVLFCEGYENA